MKKLLLIDTFNFLHRAYHALPKTFSNSAGEPTNAVYGVTSMLINVFESLKPDYVVTALDDVAPTFRVEEFTGYKAHRKPMEDDLSSQIPKVFEIIDAFGINKIVLPGYEADDVIGTIVEKFSNDVEIIIVSNDRDLWQLLRSNVMIMVPGKNGESEWIGEREAIARMGFKPSQLVDYKGLRGDPSDNIPGVPGVGEKTAKKLIEEYDTMDNLYSHIDEVSPDSLKMKLAENYEQAIMSRNLAKIITDAPLTVTLDECRYSTFNKGRVKEALEKHNFKSLIRRLGFEVDSSSSKSKKAEVPDNQLSLL